MTINIFFLSCVIAILVIPSKNQDNINKNEKLNFFLTSSEITNITTVEHRMSNLKHSELKGALKSFTIKAFGNTFIIDLSIFYPREDAEITYISKYLNTSDNFLSSGFLLHQGYVRNVNNSFVLGYFATGKPFRGYVITDEVFCIEPYESHQVLVYRFRDVITPGCVKRAEDQDLDCSETRFFLPWIANRAPPARAVFPDYNLFYDSYLEFYHRLQVQKADEKQKDGQKKHHKDETEHEDCGKTKPCGHHKSDEKNNNNNKTTVAKKSLYYFRKDEDISVSSNPGGKTGHSEVIKTSGKRQNEKDKKKRKESDNEISDEHNEDKVLKDDDRFAGSEKNFAYQVHLVDINSTSSEISQLDINGPKNINQFFSDKESLSMWKESAHEDIENYLKQAVKKEEKLRNTEPIVEALKHDPTESLQCDVQVVVAPSLLEKFDDNIEMVVKDIFTQFTLLNKIFFKVPLQRKGKTVNFFLHVRQIVIHSDQVYSPFTERANLEYFTKTNRDSQADCLRIGLVNQYLRSGDFFDGYTPEGKGGICSPNGKTLIASHGNERNPAPMALYFAALIRGITRAMGALDKDSECAKGSFPNPMQVLQNYLLTKKIEPPSGHSIFTMCNVKEIGKTLDAQSCLQRVSQPLCGNAILDPNEECDCGPIVFCRKIDPCCNTPHLLLDPEPSKVKSGSEHKGCTLIKKAKCSTLQECCVTCEINKNKSVCYNGPGDCDIAMCDGKSGSCPTAAEASNGMICSVNESLAEPFVCKDKKCDQLLCSSFELEPCTCGVGIGKDCIYCCMKDGKCQAAGTELKLFSDRNFYLPDGTECMTGICQNGECLELTGMEQGTNILKKPPHFPTKSNGRQEFSALRTIAANAFSVLILLLLQSVS